MADWFVPKRLGWGARPASWQGWVITILFTALIIAASQWLGNRPWAAAIVIAVATLTFILIVLNNTRGDLRWRWGKGDDQ